MLGLIAFAIGFAMISAMAECAIIAKRIAIGDNRPLDHRRLAAIRAALFIACACLMSLAGMDPWQAAIASPACAAIFATTHRASLNMLRGLHPLYVSPSSLYDSLFLKLSFGLTRWELMEAWHVYRMSRRTIRAGMLACIFEAVVAASSILIAATLA